MARSILEIVAPPEVELMTTVANFRQQTNITTETDSLITSLIRAASADISGYINQASDEEYNTSVLYQDLRETFLENPNQEFLILARTPIVEITLFRENGVTVKSTESSESSESSESGESGESGESSDAGMGSPTDAPFKIQRAAGYVWKMSGFRTVDFTAPHIEVYYTAGWVPPGHPTLTRTLPQEIESACVMHSRNKFNAFRDGFDSSRIRAEEIEDVGRVEYAVSARDAASSMAPEVRSLLDRYIRHGIGGIS